MGGVPPLGGPSSAPAVGVGAQRQLGPPSFGAPATGGAIPQRRAYPAMPVSVLGHWLGWGA